MDPTSPSKRPRVEEDGGGFPSFGSILHGDYAATHLEDIFSFLTGSEAIEGRKVSTFWRSVATSAPVWKTKCFQLWADKVYVPKKFTEESMPWLDAYWESLKDSKRICLTTEELCSFEWSSRMKGCAGPSWQASDPWWKGQKASVRKYSPDGTTHQADRGPGAWRFIRQTIGHDGPVGSLVRHSRAGHDFPTHFASRWSKNWGWILQNCWGFSASFPLPVKGLEPDLEDDGEVCQRVTVNTCQEEAMLFNMGVILPEQVEPNFGHVGRAIMGDFDDVSIASSADPEDDHSVFGGSVGQDEDEDDHTGFSEGSVGQADEDDHTGFSEGSVGQIEEDICCGDEWVDDHHFLPDNMDDLDDADVDALFGDCMSD
mmetsp:Transcript_35077/g.74613  ORF Transcript_35077/g.74613 Transcript_35077/m.74613 type:complete len:371 (+) Transcript_35077:203-1315(+)